MPDGVVEIRLPPHAYRKPKDRPKRSEESQFGITQRGAEEKKKKKTPVTEKNEIRGGGGGRQQGAPSWTGRVEVKPGSTQRKSQKHVRIRGEPKGNKSREELIKRKCAEQGSLREITGGKSTKDKVSQANTTKRPSPKQNLGRATHFQDYRSHRGTGERIDLLGNGWGGVCGIDQGPSS